MRKSGFRYDCEKFTIDEIKEFIENKGFKLTLVDRRPKGSLGYSVNGQDIWIEYPDPSLLENEKVWQIYGPPSIGWIPDAQLIMMEVYYARESGDSDRIKKAEENYESYKEIAKKTTKKLYDQLKRKFAIKKGEYPQFIKDLDRIKFTLSTAQGIKWFPGLRIK